MFFSVFFFLIFFIFLFVGCLKLHLETILNIYISHKNQNQKSTVIRHDTNKKKAHTDRPTFWQRRGKSKKKNSLQEQEKGEKTDENNEANRREKKKTHSPNSHFTFILFDVREFNRPSAEMLWAHVMYWADDIFRTRDTAIPFGSIFLLVDSAKDFQTGYQIICTCQRKLTAFSINYVYETIRFYFFNFFFALSRFGSPAMLCVMYWLVVRTKKNIK